MTNLRNAGCPHPDCQTPNPIQCDLSPGQKEQTRLVETERAMRCCYCDCVYTVDPNGDKNVRGHFEANGFVPYRLGC
jgi:hypothetical protein